MLYSQMSAEQRQTLEDPRNYPLRVSFLGKKGILTFEEVAFLRRNGVDFDIDDRQLAAILGAEQDHSAGTK